MSIAITTYIDNNVDLIREFNWLLDSWIYSGSCKVSDIVAFYNPSIDRDILPSNLLSGDVYFIPQKPLTELEPEWANYPFINSTHFLTTPLAGETLSGYEYILKTDNDCFLTPNFPSLKPRLATFGVGLYATEPIVVARLAQISAKWGISPVFNSVGSTFMAKTSRALTYAQYHMEYCKKLKAEEFPDGYGTWPEWYFGVLTMYAGCLAANAVFGTGITLGGLDVHCMANEKMCSTDYHIHAFHTYDHFSKFKWRQGGYKDYNMSLLDKENIADYCLYIAKSGPCE